MHCLFTFQPSKGAIFEKKYLKKTIRIFSWIAQSLFNCLWLRLFVRARDCSRGKFVRARDCGRDSLKLKPYKAMFTHSTAACRRYWSLAAVAARALVSRNSSVGRALDWRSKGPWFNPGFRHGTVRRLTVLTTHAKNTWPQASGIWNDVICWCYAMRSKNFARDYSAHIKYY